GGRGGRDGGPFLRVAGTVRRHRRGGGGHRAAAPGGPRGAVPRRPAGRGRRAPRFPRQLAAARSRQARGGTVKALVHKGSRSYGWLTAPGRMLPGFLICGG